MRIGKLPGAIAKALSTCAALVLVATAFGQDAARDEPRLHGALDGMRFVGSFGPADAAGGKPDTITFRDGRFWSAICVPCGFVPGVYWVRREGDAIHFTGTMGSHERGRFLYEGVIRDGKMSAKVNWRKERWYWTVDRDFRFEGGLDETPVIESARTAMLRAIAAAGGPPQPVEICPL